MFQYFKNKKKEFLFISSMRLLVSFLTASLVFSPSAAQAQSLNLLNLPIPGTMVMPTPAFVPVLLKGMTIDPTNPLKFDFIVDSGNTEFTQDQVKEESEKLVKYFLASMTVPKDDMWVNLSPYEKDRIVPDELGKTDLGRDLLAQDYILKQLTASLMYPEEELGKEFWDKIYQRAQEEFGTSEIPVDTFNKVWILPEAATVYEHENTVYVVNARLKVMLDSDYEAMTNSVEGVAGSNGLEHRANSVDTDTMDLSKQIIKEIILPEIEKEVNEGKNFAPLRQIYHSLILAKWYKETVKNSLLNKVYTDQNKIAGIDIENPEIKDEIYGQYMEAYKKGVFNYIKEDYDRLSQEIIPRKYFSGGITGDVEIMHAGSPVGDPGTPMFRVKVEVIGQKEGSSSPASKSVEELAENYLWLYENGDLTDKDINAIQLGRIYLDLEYGKIKDRVTAVLRKVLRENDEKLEKKIEEYGMNNHKFYLEKREVSDNLKDYPGEYSSMKEGVRKKIETYKGSGSEIVENLEALGISVEIYQDVVDTVGMERHGGFYFVHTWFEVPQDQIEKVRDFIHSQGLPLAQFQGEIAFDRKTPYSYQYWNEDRYVSKEARKELFSYGRAVKPEPDELSDDKEYQSEGGEKKRYYKSFRRDFLLDFGLVEYTGYEHRGGNGNFISAGTAANSLDGDSERLLIEIYMQYSSIPGSYYVPIEINKNEYLMLKGLDLGPVDHHGKLSSGYKYVEPTYLGRILSLVGIHRRGLRKENLEDKNVVDGIQKEHREVMQIIKSFDDITKEKIAHIIGELENFEIRSDQVSAKTVNSSKIVREGLVNQSDENVQSSEEYSSFVIGRDLKDDQRYKNIVDVVYNIKENFDLQSLQSAYLKVQKSFRYSFKPGNDSMRKIVLKEVEERLDELEDDLDWERRYGKPRNEIVRENDLLNLLTIKFNIESSYITKKTDWVSYAARHYFVGVYEELLFVPEEFADFVEFYLSIGETMMDRILSGGEDARYKGIVKILEDIAPDFNEESLYEVYQGKKEKFTDPSYTEDGLMRSILVSEGIEQLDTLDEDIEFENQKTEIDEDPLLSLVKEKLNIENAYMRFTYRVRGNNTPSRHFGIGVTNKYIYVPKEVGDLVELIVLADKSVVQYSLFGELASFADEVKREVRVLGKGVFQKDMGNKAAGFLLFEKLGLPYPPGIILSSDLVNAAIKSGSWSDYAPFVDAALERNGFDISRKYIQVEEGSNFWYSPEAVVVRSNPKQSMPGILESEQGTMISLFSTVESVANAWFTDKAQVYRQQKGISDNYDLPLIIQKFIRPFGPGFHGAGVFSTRNPNTNEDVLFGRYLENMTGDALMTGGHKGKDINNLQTVAPEIYDQILDAKRKLEDATGYPQEVEFVVSDGQLYFVQTRKLTFTPQAASLYIEELLEDGKISQARAIPYYERLFEQVGRRTLYKVKEDKQKEILAQGISSVPGAMQGRVAFSVEKAQEFALENTPVILVSTKKTQDEMLNLIFSIPDVGLITNYGNDSSHEAVLTRSAGIPAIINIQNTSVENNYFIFEGQVVKEGEVIGIDGHNNQVFISDENIIEEDKVILDISHGIDVEELAQSVLAEYVDKDGEFKSGVTYEQLLQVNVHVANEWKQAETEGDKQKVFELNWKKHVLHDLLLRKGVDENKSRSQVDEDLIQITLKENQQSSSPLTSNEQQATNDKEIGGIDLNEIDVERQGGGVSIEFDPIQMQQMLNMNIDGFAPVIISITPLPSILPLLGLAPQREEDEEFEVSSLN